VAKQILSYKAFAYYYSASDDEICWFPFPSDLSFSSTQLIHSRLYLANRENARAFSRFFFRARILRSVSHCDPSTTILGFESSIPIFVSGAALAKLGHPEGQSLFCCSESSH
jgi:L-lactate dehydrogenase (cytochrome)